MTTTYNGIKIVTEMGENGAMLHVVFDKDNNPHPFTSMMNAMTFAQTL